MVLRLPIPPRGLKALPDPPQGSVDSSTLAKLQRGDEAAAALFCDLFGEEIDRWVWRSLGADQEHDDLVHQVLCECLRCVGRVREAHSLHGWVRRLTVNVVRSELRRRRVRRLWSQPEDNPDRFRSLATQPEEREKLGAIYRVLDRLQDRDRWLLALRHFENWSFDEMAEALGCSVRTVKRHLPRAEARFRRQAEREPALRPGVDREDAWNH